MSEPGTAPAARSAQLVSYGFRTWPQCQQLLADAEATWLGTATIHREAAFQRVPALPLTTRIHAWTADGVLWRLLPYPDRASALVTALLPDGATDASPETPAAVEDVVVAVEWDGQWERHWVRGLSPLLFLRPTDSSQA